MKRLTGLALSLAAAGAIVFLTACVAPPPPKAVFVSTAPPAAEVEVIGTAPGPDFFWIRGYHTWDGGRYVWSPGRWERRPSASAVWVEGPLGTPQQGLVLDRGPLEIKAGTPLITRYR